MTRPPQDEQGSAHGRWFNEDVDVALFIERHRGAVIATAALAPLLVCTVLSAFRGSITNATAVLVLVLLVIAAASTGVRAAGIVAAVSGGIWFDIFLTQPYGRPNIDDPNDLEATILLVVIGAAVTEVALWGHRQQARANRRAGYLKGVVETAEVIRLRADTPDALIAHVAGEIREILGADSCRFVPGPVYGEGGPVLDHQGQVTRNGHQVDVDRDGLPTDDEIRLLVTRGGTTVGRFRITAVGHVARPSLEQRKVAVLLADQAGTVLSDPAT